MIEYGHCHCGCGEKTKLSAVNNKRLGLSKETPNKYIIGHSSKKVTKTTICPRCKSKEKGKRGYCIECAKAKDAEYVAANIGKLKERRRRSFREVMLNEEEHSAHLKRRSDNFCKNSKQLSDSYLKHVISWNNRLRSKDISKDLIGIYRELIKLRRMVRKTKLKGEQYVEHERTTGSIVSTGGKVADG